MNCREFLAEFEERRGALSQTARLHMDDCPGCKKTSGEQTRVWEMIDGLRRVDAPNDFDFRVKAKIANAKPADFQPRFLPVLRYVLPLSLVVLVVGLFAFNTSFFFGGENAPQVAGTVVLQTPEKEIAPINSFPSNQTAVSNPTNDMLTANIAGVAVEPAENKREKQFTAVNFSPKSQTSAPKKKAKDNFGAGSHVLSFKPPSQPVKLPQGINPNQTVETLPNANISNSMTDEEIFPLLGIEVVKEDGNLKVKTVKENSSAALSGVKAGDTIEAVDGVKPSAQPPRTKRVEVKKLTLMRGAEKIEITLKN